MTYEYVCTGCGHLWEAEQRISAEPLKECPACGAAKARRQVSGGMGFILKGGGWYADGYSSSGKKGGGFSSGSSETSKSSTPAGSTDSPATPKAAPPAAPAAPATT
jgi:putative FmdB family regulatory protein